MRLGSPDARHSAGLAVISKPDFPAAWAARRPSWWEEARPTHLPLQLTCAPRKVSGARCAGSVDNQQDSPTRALWEEHKDAIRSCFCSWLFILMENQASFFVPPLSIGHAAFSSEAALIAPGLRTPERTASVSLNGGGPTAEPPPSQAPPWVRH